MPELYVGETVDSNVMAPSGTNRAKYEIYRTELFYRLHIGNKEVLRKIHLAVFILGASVVMPKV
jgi:hypothetical protein